MSLRKINVLLRISIAGFTSNLNVMKYLLDIHISYHFNGCL